MDDLDQVNRRRALVADRKKLASGWRPDATMLAEAPAIEDWYFDHYPSTRNICLVGKATGHPILGDQVITTSALVAIDPQFQWARSQNRFYRLGRRAPFRAIDTDCAGWEIIDV